MISSKSHHEIGNPPLHNSTKTLHGPSNNELSLKGQFRAVLECRSKAVEKDLYVVEGLHKHLLRRPAMEALTVVTRIRSVQGGVSPREHYPQLFTGLGKLEGEYCIQLEEGAKPYALSVPCRVAIPLMVLANTSRWGKFSPDHIYYPVWQILLSSSTIRNDVGPRTFSTLNGRPTSQLGGCCVYDE